jgi:hypothetical protein
MKCGTAIRQVEKLGKMRRGRMAMGTVLKGSGNILQALRQEDGIPPNIHNKTGAGRRFLPL